MEAFVFGTIIF